VNPLVWLVLLPLAGSIALGLAEVHHRLSAATTSVIALSCLLFALAVPVGAGGALGLGWQWRAQDTLLAVVLYGAALVLSVLAWLGPAGGFPGPPILSAAALFTLAIMLRDPAQTLLIVPLALTVLAACGTGLVDPQSPGWTHFLAQAGLSMPIVAGVLIVWPQTTGLPWQAPLLYGVPWLTLLLAMLWLGTFPFDGAVRLVGRDDRSVGVALLWAAKDVAIGYAVLKLWQAYPDLRTAAVGVTLGAVGLVTTVSNGALAGLARDAAALSGPLANSVLGVAVAWLGVRGDAGDRAAMALLLARAIAGLVAAAAMRASQVAGIDRPPLARALWRWLPPLALAGSQLWLLRSAWLHSSGITWPALGGGAAAGLSAALALSTISVGVGLARVLWSWPRPAAMAHRRSTWAMLLFLCLTVLAALWLAGRLPGLAASLSAALVPAGVVVAG